MEVFEYYLQPRLFLIIHLRKEFEVHLVLYRFAFALLSRHTFVCVPKTVLLCLSPCSPVESLADPEILFKTAIDSLVPSVLLQASSAQLGVCVTNACMGSVRHSYRLQGEPAVVRIPVSVFNAYKLCTAVAHRRENSVAH